MDEADFWRRVGDDPGVNLLVWGPGEHGPDYPLRVAVKETLQGFFAKGTVLFSEDDTSTAPAPTTWLGRLAVQERLQAARSNVVYIIPTSPGAKLELILFSRYKEVSTKLHVLMPAHHNDDSFMGRVFADALALLERNHQVQRFDTFTDTTVAAYCLDHARAWYMMEHPEGPPSLI
jgi:hypothetical protein